MIRTIILLFLLAGCASQQRFEEVASSHLGLTEEQIVDRLGPPSGTYEIGEIKYLTWAHKSVRAPAYYSSAIGSSAMLTPIGGGVRSCAVIYKMEPDEVIDLTDKAEPTVTVLKATSYRYKGNDCRL